MIDGNTRLIAHVGYPTGTFKAPLIYNPYFESIGCNAVVVPMGVKPDDFESAFPAITRFSNFHGALVTMPYKIAVSGLMDRVSPAASIAGSCNAVRRCPDGALEGDMFDGEGFARGMLRRGRTIRGAAALIVGSGGVGSAIAAALAAHGLARLGLHDLDEARAAGVAERLSVHFPDLEVSTGGKDPSGYGIVVNATPLGMEQGDPLPLDPARLMPSAFVGEVVLKAEKTDFLRAAEARGCEVQPGIDMLFEQIPAYLEFFGLPAADADTLRSRARIRY